MAFKTYIAEGHLREGDIVILTRDDRGRVVRHWTLDEAEKADARRREQAFEQMLRARPAPRPSIWRRAAEFAVSLLPRAWRPSRRPMETL